MSRKHNFVVIMLTKVIAEARFLVVLVRTTASLLVWVVNHEQFLEYCLSGCRHLRVFEIFLDRLLVLTFIFTGIMVQVCVLT